MGSVEPRIFRGQVSQRHDTGFRPTNDPAYSLLKQNEGNPHNQYSRHGERKYKQHSKEFLHHEEIHLKPHLNALLYHVEERYGTVKSASRALSCGTDKRNAAFGRL